MSESGNTLPETIETTASTQDMPPEPPRGAGLDQSLWPPLTPKRKPRAAKAPKQIKKPKETKKSSVIALSATPGAAFL